MSHFGLTASRLTSRDRAVDRVNCTTAPSKTRVNTRLFSSGPMSPKGLGRRDILACLRVCKEIRGSIQWPRCARVLRAATVRERLVVTPVQPLAYARGSLGPRIYEPR